MEHCCVDPAPLCDSSRWRWQILSHKPRFSRAFKSFISLIDPVAFTLIADAYIYVIFFLFKCPFNLSRQCYFFIFDLTLSLVGRRAFPGLEWNFLPRTSLAQKDEDKTRYNHIRKERLPSPKSPISLHFHLCLVLWLGLFGSQCLPLVIKLEAEPDTESY